MLENELKAKCCSDPKLIWPVLFKRFIDDGFGITKGLRKDVMYWIEKFNGLRKTVQIDKYNWGNALSSVVARENVHISQYPTPKNETRAKRKTSNFWRQKSALERACFTWP